MSMDIQTNIGDGVMKMMIYCGDVKKTFLILTQNNYLQRDIVLVGLEFNGYTSQVKIPKPFKLKNYTLFCSFNPDEIECNEGFMFDEYNILSIPGMDTGFTFNSYKRYKFETWMADKECISLKSNITTPKQTTFCASINQDEQIIKFYQDGELVDELNMKVEYSII